MALYYNWGDNPTRTSNNCRYLCTQHGSTQIRETINNMHKHTGAVPGWLSVKRLTHFLLRSWSLGCETKPLIGVHAGHGACLGIILSFSLYLSTLWKRRKRFLKITYIKVLIDNNIIIVGDFICTELPLFEQSGSCIENTTHRALLYLIWHRVCSQQTSHQVIC